MCVLQSVCGVVFVAASCAQHRLLMGALRYRCAALFPTWRACMCPPRLQHIGLHMRSETQTRKKSSSSLFKRGEYATPSPANHSCLLLLFVLLAHPSSFHVVFAHHPHHLPSSTNAFVLFFGGLFGPTSKAEFSTHIKHRLPFDLCCCSSFAY
jgi:hypothetical protein